MCKIQLGTYSKNWVQIPARDFNIDRSVETLCRYSNSRGLGDMCCLRYCTERDGTSLQVIPVLTRHSIDGAVAVVCILQTKQRYLILVSVA